MANFSEKARIKMVGFRSSFSYYYCKLFWGVTHSLPFQNNNQHSFCTAPYITYSSDDVVFLHPGAPECQKCWRGKAWYICGGRNLPPPPD